MASVQGDDAVGSATLQTVDRALRVLVTFTRERPTWSHSELARATGLHKTILHRILVTLEAHGFVERDPLSRAYQLGPTVRELGAVATAGLSLRSAALPEMRRLVELTGETSWLAVRDGFDVVCIDTIPSPAPFKVSYPVGYRVRLHTGAAGKGLLAFLPAEECARLLAEMPLIPYTERTLTDPAAIEAECARIRAAGYAVSEGEINPGVAGISAPIWGSQGQLVGNISIIGPALRFREGRLPQLCAWVAEAARAVSRRLGYTATASATPTAERV